MTFEVVVVNPFQAGILFGSGLGIGLMLGLVGTFLVTSFLNDVIP